MSLATCVRERRKLSASVVMMLTVTPPPDPPRSKARVSARLSTRSPRCRIAGTSSGRRPGDAAAVQSAARRRRRAPGPAAAAPSHPPCRRRAARWRRPARGCRARRRARWRSAPSTKRRDRDLGEVGEDRGDEVAHAELAGLHELAHRVLGAAEAADQRIADALAGLLRLLGVVAHRLGRELPAGLRRLGRFRHLRRRGGAGAAGLADRIAELLRRDRRAAERGLRLLGRALHRVAQRLQRGERRGGGAGRGRGGGGEPVGPGAGLAGGGRGLVEGRARPGSPPRSRSAWCSPCRARRRGCGSRHAGSRPSCAGCRRARSASRPRSSPRPTAATAPATARRA